MVECPCDGEQPDPCPRCGATVARGICQAAYLDQHAIDLAVAAYRETVVAWLRAEAAAYALHGLPQWAGAIRVMAWAIVRGEPEAWAKRHA